jgi:hypothetical protein
MDGSNAPIIVYPKFTLFILDTGFAIIFTGDRMVHSVITILTRLDRLSIQPYLFPCFGVLRVACELRS